MSELKTSYKVVTIDDHFEAFMWAYAIWYWLSHHHEGQSSNKYMLMSNMPTKFQMTNIPDINFEVKGDNYLDDENYQDDSNDNDENYQAIENYHKINDENYQLAYDEFEYYMENEWDLDE